MSYLVPGSCFIRGCLHLVSFSSTTDRVEPLAYGFLVLMMTLGLDIDWTFFFHFRYRRLLCTIPVTFYALALNPYIHIHRYTLFLIHIPFH